MSYEENTPLLADGWEDCFIGFGSVFAGSAGIRRVAVYDLPKMIDKLIKESAQDCADRCECDHYGDAVEYLEFNVIGAYVGPNTPVYVTPNTLEDAIAELESY